MNEVYYLFLIIGIGYLLGRLRYKGVGLGISAILLVALIFGHFGVDISSTIRNLGLSVFICAVGLITGPTFLDKFKKNGKYYALTGILMIVITSILCGLIIYLFKLPLDLGLGIMAGSLSSTPCLATALEISQSNNVSIGYGIAYPFGVIGVVLAVQLISKLFKQIYDPNDQVETSDNRIDKSLYVIDKNGFFVFSMALAMGILIGRIKIPLGNNISFSLGISGGVLLTSLLFGALKKVGNISLAVDKKVMSNFRELGLAIFLASAGVQAGAGFIDTVRQYGLVLFVMGIVLTIVPILTGFIIAYKVFDLDLYCTLGCICGGMTSTSALGSLAELDGYEEIAAGYAATYSVSLIVIIFMTQILYLVLG